MLRQIASIARVRKLYLQLLYQCNFSCQHCFHGENLRRQERFTPREAELILRLFRDEYSVDSVTFLGGEPFLYPQLWQVARFARGCGMEVEVCTNGYKIEESLKRMVDSDSIQHLRVSLDGLEGTHDQIRKKGSFSSALSAIGLGVALGVRTSITMTVTRLNLSEVIPVARLLLGLGVEEMKLHCLRILGNATKNPQLKVGGGDEYLNLLRDIDRVLKGSPMRLLLDDDIDPDRMIVGQLEGATGELERIEVQPDGRIYISCKAVGDDSNAFIFDKTNGVILYRPASGDELVRGVKQVNYAKIGG